MRTTLFLWGLCSYFMIDAVSKANSKTLHFDFSVSFKLIGSIGNNIIGHFYLPHATASMWLFSGTWVNVPLENAKITALKHWEVKAGHVRHTIAFSRLIWVGQRSTGLQTKTNLSYFLVCSRSRANDREVQNTLLRAVQQTLYVFGYHQNFNNIP